MNLNKEKHKRITHVYQKKLKTNRKQQTKNNDDAWHGKREKIGKWNKTEKTRGKIHIRKE